MTFNDFIATEKVLDNRIGDFIDETRCRAHLEGEIGSLADLMKHVAGKMEIYLNRGSDWDRRHTEEYMVENAAAATWRAYKRKRLR